MRQRKHWLRMARIFQFVRYAGHTGVLLPRLGIPRQDIFSHTIIAYTSRIASLFLKLIWKNNPDIPIAYIYYDKKYVNF